MTEKNNVNVFPVFQYRFNKAVQKVKKSTQENELGKPFLATVRTRWCRPQRYYDRDPWRGTFSHDGGATTNQGIHHLDLLRYLTGEIKKVNAQMKTYGVDVEVEDTVVANIEFESGALGLVEITTAARPDDFESSISVLGENGIAIIGGWATNELTTFSPNPIEEKLNSEDFPDVYGFGHKKIYIGAYETLFSNGNPAVTFEDAMKTIQLLHAIYRSAETGKWVDIADNLESKYLGQPNEEISSLYRTEL
jgi:predicted dehydrogenase